MLSFLFWVLVAASNPHMSLSLQSKDVDNTATSDVVSVVIVGAGAASIKLAHRLWEESSMRSPDAPKFQITILEANDYIGGRVRSFSFEGHTVELGANWISGREAVFDNPIWKLAKEIDLGGHVSDRDNPEKILVLDCCEDGKSIEKTEEYLKTVERFDGMYAKAVNQAASTGKILPQSDVSVRHMLEANGWPKRELLNNIERAVEHNVLEVWASEQLENLSGAHDMKAGANDVDLGQDEMFVEDPRGFNSIFASMVQDLRRDGFARILLQREVQSLDYTPGQTRVVAKNLCTGELEEYAADLIVSTVSLGVLQSEAIRFIPQLPDWKVKALNEIKMFNFAKVFAKFSKAPWPESKDYLVFVPKGEHKRGFYPFWMKYKSSDGHLLMCYLGGAEARRVEALSEGEIKDEIEGLFRKAFGDRAECRPLSVAVTDWSRNPHFSGSYSYFPNGAFGQVPTEDLCKSLYGQESKNDTDEMGPPTLYFAGEAFDDKFNGWVQGGYLSGERVARAILSDFQPTKSGKV